MNRRSFVKELCAACIVGSIVPVVVNKPKVTSLTLELRDGAIVWCDYDEMKRQQDFMKQKEEEYAQWVSNGGFYRSIYE